MFIIFDKKCYQNKYIIFYVKCKNILNLKIKCDHAYIHNTSSPIFITYSYLVSMVSLRTLTLDMYVVER